MKPRDRHKHRPDAIWLGRDGKLWHYTEDGRTEEQYFSPVTIEKMRKAYPFMTDKEFCKEFDICQPTCRKLKKKHDFSPKDPSVKTRIHEQIVDTTRRRGHYANRDIEQLRLWKLESLAKETPEEKQARYAKAAETRRKSNIPKWKLRCGRERLLKRSGTKAMKKRP